MNEENLNAKRPVIGLTPYHNVSNNAAAVSLRYIDCIIKAGGTPIILPNMADEASIDHAVSLCDGIIFTGGSDVDPALYGERPIWALGSTSPMNDQNDPLIFKAAFGRRMPILGICRGCQILTVLLGGTLYQDLGVQFEPQNGELLTHVQKEQAYVCTHGVVAEEGSFVAQCFGGTAFKVNSFHHQAIKTCPKDCVVTARATDGVAEAMTMPGYPFFEAVQFHPEGMAAHSEGAMTIFKKFVEACR